MPLPALLALAAAAMPPLPVPPIPFEKYELPNGLTVILSEDHRLPEVAVDVWYHVGAANQTPGKSGFAHLFEHMMFSGAKHIGPQPIRVLENIGAGLWNGTTTYDRTNYFETVPADELPTALWLESDRMGFLLDTLDPKKLAVQRGVVSNERRQSYENRPYGSTDLRECDLLWPKPHPYYDCVIGTIAEIQGASMTDLRDFFHRYYAPDNASIAIVGDFDPATAKALVAQYFGPIPKGPPVTRPTAPPAHIDSVVRETVHDPVAKVPMLSMLWTGVKPFSPDEAPGDVLARILGQGETSRLYRKLVLEKPLASSVAAGNPTLGLGGFFELDVIPREGKGVADVAPVVEAVLADIRAKGVTQDEVARAVRNILAGKLRGLERLGGFGGKADTLDRYEMWTGDPGYLSKDLARYTAVTPEAVQAFARKYLDPEHRLILDTEPTAPTADAR
ncbi:MAG TPA: pitrilysin family protein [Myxococcales bacterium]|nr:pitrilysin family protein [Myxococcales bacterium]